MRNIRKEEDEVADVSEVVVMSFRSLQVSGDVAGRIVYITRARLINDHDR